MKLVVLIVLLAFFPIKSMEADVFQQLFAAIEHNNPRLLQEKKRILTQVIDKDGNSLLHKAVACQNTDMIQELLRLAPTLKNKSIKQHTA